LGFITVSIGVSTFDGAEPLSAADLMVAADRAPFYMAKGAAATLRCSSQSTILESGGSPKNNVKLVTHVVLKGHGFSGCGRTLEPTLF
jgi:hypothetical protein